MKGQNLVLVLVVVIMLASLGGTYFLFSQQGTMSGQKMDALKTDIDNLSASLKKVDSGFQELETKSKGYADSIRSLEEKINAADSDRRDISAKVEDLMKAVDDIKVAAKSAAVVAEVKASSPEPATEVAPAVSPEETPVAAESETVDLGQIPVQK